MIKICGYSCKHNKSGVCQISVCDKTTIMSDKTEVQTLRYDELDYTIVPNSDIKPLLDKLQQENKILKENAENNDKVVDKVNWENQLLKKENEQLKDKLSKIETLIINHNCDTGDIYYKYNSKFLKSELKQRILEIVYEEGSDSNVKD